MANAAEIRPRVTPVWRAAELLQRGDVAGAAARCRAVLARDPADQGARVLLACALLAGGSDWQGALAAAEAALAVAPMAAPAHFVRGTALHALGDAAAAVDALHMAVALAPADAASWLNLGNALATLDLLEEAEAALRRACALDPGSAIAQASLGTALVQRLRLPGAIAAYRAALRLRPDFAGARWDLGFAQLLGGDFAAGWEAWRQRKPEEDVALAGWGVAGPEWDGATPDGWTLLVCSSQGLGDAIQFARYLPLLAARGARVLLACDPRLAPLLIRLDGVAGVVIHGEKLPPHDGWVALSSLPRLFATHPGTIPAPHGYLTAEPTLVAAWRPKLPVGRRRIGLVWAGNPTHANDARRSMAPASLAPVLALSEATFVSLQLGGDTLPAEAGVADVASQLTDFAETAAALTALDLLITVDTAVAHLAGALGRPAWVALPWAPDWRWQVGRSDSPWYASLRLFRQPRTGDWGGVAAGLAAALREAGRG